MDQVVSVQNKNFTRNPEKLAIVLELDRKPKVIYIDNSLEFGKACADLSWNHCTSTPHRSETNGIAGSAQSERRYLCNIVAIRSGKNWCAVCMKCYTYLRNIQDLLI